MVRPRKSMIKFILLVNKQGQTRVAQYYQYTPLQERIGLESEIVRRCLSIPDNSVRPSVPRATIVIRGCWTESAPGTALTHVRVCICFSSIEFVPGLPRSEGGVPAIRVALLYCGRGRGGGTLSTFACFCTRSGRP